MKRLIWAGVLSIILAAILIWGNISVQSTCNELLDDISLCAKEKNKISAQKRAEIIENNWLKKEAFLTIFINRNTVQEIGVHISLILKTAKEPDSLDFAVACRETQVLLTHAVKNQQLLF